MSKMNPEIKARWVAALRSGEYKQGTRVLKGANGFCCLGVLCDLYAGSKGIAQWNSQDLGAPGEDLPAREVCEWAGFPPRYADDDDREPTLENDFKVEIAGRTTFLSSHNDGDDYIRPPLPPRTFAEIADAIEKQL